MKLSLFLSAALCVLSAASALSLPASSGAPARQSEVIPNRYIVKLRPRTSRTAVRAHLADYKRKAVLSGDMDEAGSANQIATEYSKVLNGFAGSFSETYLDSLRAQFGDAIEYIAPDMTVHAFDEPVAPRRSEQGNPPSWGLARVSQRKLDLKAPYRYLDNAGEGVTVWILDTGVLHTHSDFDGRASLNATFVQGETTPDGNGHGTHCAGTVGSRSYGVAKKATIKGVKVLSGSGSGTLAGVISGMDHVAKHVVKGKTVMSMSLGGGKSQPLNDALSKAVASGVVAIVAAGNNNGDACQISPASAEGAYTVGATDNADKKASFSNWGKCVKINAPGVAITSLWTGADGKTNTISGTSMATPHVAGVAAAIMSQKDYGSPQEVYAELTRLATKNMITGLGNGTPNLLLFNGQSDEGDVVGPVVPEEPKPEEPKPEQPAQPAQP